MDVRSFMKKKSSTPSKPRRRAVRVAVTKTGKATPALRKAVKSIVASEMEVKKNVRLLENYVLHNSAITAADWVYPVPTLAQGSGEMNRQGDRIYPKALIVKVHVSFSSGTGGFPALNVRLHVVKHKKYTSEATLSANISTENGKLLDGGDGQTFAYDGTIASSQYPVNTEIWTPVKTINLPLSRDQTAPGGPGYNYKTYTIRIPCPKVLTYSLGATLPDNFCPAMALGWNYIDGSGPSVLLTPVMMYAQSYFTFTDA